MAYHKNIGTFIGISGQIYRFYCNDIGNIGINENIFDRFDLFCVCF